MKTFKVRVKQDYSYVLKKGEIYEACYWDNKSIDARVDYPTKYIHIIKLEKVYYRNNYDIKLFETLS